jgi:hypothetical protein
MSDLLQPKDFKVVCQDGKERTYLLSKFPAVQGREIISKYPLSAMPKIGDYAVNEETMLKLMSYVAVEQKNGNLRLSTMALVNNHVPDWETLGKIEIEMMQYNCSFFLKDKALTFLDACLQTIVSKATEILTASLQPSSVTTKQPFTN